MSNMSKTMSCNGSLLLVFGLVFKERNIFFSFTQRTVCGASGKVWNVFVLITREGKSDENKRPLWIVTKALPSCPPLWSFQDMPSLKILKKSIRRKRTLDFFLWSADEIYDVLYLRIGDTRAILWEKKYQHKRTRTLLVCWRYLVHNTKKSCLFFCNYLQGNEQKGLFIIRC